MKLFSTLFGLILFSTITISQTTIYGKIADEASGEELIYANIVLNKNGVFAAGGMTDFDGDFSLPVSPGTYDVIVSYTGYPDFKKEGVIISAGQRTKLDIKIKKGIPPGNTVATTCGTALIQQDNTTNGKTISSEEIAKLPKKNINAIAAITSKCFSSDEGEPVTAYIDCNYKIKKSNYIEPTLSGTPAAFENDKTLPVTNIASIAKSAADQRIIRSSRTSAIEYSIDGVRVKYTPSVSVHGIIQDETTQEPLIGAHIIFKKEGKYIDATISDFDGEYSIDLSADHYDIEVSYMGYQTDIEKSFNLSKAKKLEHNVSLMQGVILEEVVIMEYRIPLIKECHYSSGYSLRTSCFSQKALATNKHIPTNQQINPASPAGKHSTNKPRFYPNPASTYFNISSAKKIGTLQVFSSNGKLIYQQNEIQESKIEIQIAHWPAGMYFVNLMIDGESITKQLMVSKN